LAVSFLDGVDVRITALIGNNGGYTEDILVRCEVCVPRPEGQDHYRLAARAELIGKKRSADERLNPEDIEVSGGDRFALDAAGSAVTQEHDA